MFFYIVLTQISTTSGLSSTDNTRKYHQIDVYIYQCDVGCIFLAIGSGKDTIIVTLAYTQYTCN